METKVFQFVWRKDIMLYSIVANESLFQFIDELRGGHSSKLIVSSLSILFDSSLQLSLMF